MNILYDSAMPYAVEFFDGLGRLSSFSAGSLEASALASADILLVRSTTQINQQLLTQAPKLKIVGTATAGFDHFDVNAIENAGVKWMASPGCNARAVAEYVCCALLTAAENVGFSLSNKSLGIVGAGQVGSRVANLMQYFGMRTINCDPPRARRETQFQSAALEEALNADIVSLHVPLTREGEDPTYHMLNAKLLGQMSAGQVLINACRGDVIDPEALLQLKNDLFLVIDCWPNEPNVNKDLINASDIATAHIAGHTLEGKARGTEMLYQQLCALIKKDIDRHLINFLPDMAPTEPLLHALQQIENDGISQHRLMELCRCFYNISKDEAAFRQCMSNTDSFSEFRRNYPIRREFDAISLEMHNSSAARQLRSLGFSIK
ncbi:MAG: 4-phosphoerythronate dehydrogenase [Pseudomonadota bacterium]